MTPIVDPAILSERRSCGNRSQSKCQGPLGCLGLQWTILQLPTVSTQYEKLDEEFMRHYEHASGRVDLIIGFIDVEVGQSSAVWRSALRAEVKLTAVLNRKLPNAAA